MEGHVPKSYQSAHSVASLEGSGSEKFENRSCYEVPSPSILDPNRLGFVPAPGENAPLDTSSEYHRYAVYELRPMLEYYALQRPK